VKAITPRNIPIDQLVAAPVNANKMAPEVYERLVAAMKRLGQLLQPPLVRSAFDRPGCYEIIDGHHRVQAARDAGLLSLLCVVCDDLSNEEVRMLALGMNRVRGEIDLSIASTVLIGMPDYVTRDVLDLAGFSDDELTALLEAGSPDEPEPAMEPDPTPAPGAKLVLELEFSDASLMKRARRGLRRAAGKGGTLAQGVINLLEGKS
jgi:ParB-like nuclease domain